MVDEACEKHRPDYDIQDNVQKEGYEADVIGPFSLEGYCAIHQLHHTFSRKHGAT